MVPDEPLTLQNAVRLAREIALNGTISLSSHCQARMTERGITAIDIDNAIRGGRCTMFDLEHGTYRYQIGTNKHTVVVSFDEPDELTVVTCW